MVSENAVNSLALCNRIFSPLKTFVVNVAVAVFASWISFRLYTLYSKNVFRAASVCVTSKVNVAEYLSTFVARAVRTLFKVTYTPAAMCSSKVMTSVI